MYAPSTRDTGPAQWWDADGASHAVLELHAAAPIPESHSLVAMEAIAGLQDRVTVLQSENRALASQLHDVRAASDEDKRALTRRVRRAARSLKLKTRELEDQVAACERAREEKEQSEREAAATVRSLASDLEAARQAKDALSHRLQRATADAERVKRQEAEQAKAEASRREGERRRWEARLEKEQQTVRELRRERGAMEQEQTALREALQRAREFASELLGLTEEMTAMVHPDARSRRSTEASRRRCAARQAARDPRPFILGTSTHRSFSSWLKPRRGREEQAGREVEVGEEAGTRERGFRERLRELKQRFVEGTR